jgi:hypothetical protein
MNLAFLLHAVCLFAVINNFGTLRAETPNLGNRVHHEVLRLAQRDLRLLAVSKNTLETLSKNNACLIDASQTNIGRRVPEINGVKSVQRVRAGLTVGVGILRIRTAFKVNNSAFVKLFTSDHVSMYSLFDLPNKVKTYKLRPGDIVLIGDYGDIF